MPQEYNLIGLDGLTHVYPEWFYCLLYGTHRILRSNGEQIRKLLQLSASPYVPILVRDKESGYYRITQEAVRQLRPLLESSHFNPRRQVRCSSVAGGIRSASGKGLMDMIECGIDAAVTRRELDDMLQALDDTPLPGRAHSQLLADQALKQSRRSM